VALARGGAKMSFAFTDADMSYLQTTLHTMMDLVDEKTRGWILDRGTLALGVVVRPDGHPALVYTVAGNRTYKSLRAAADKVGATRWEATGRAEGRGSVGAPNDAEQLMFEAATTNGFKVAGMVVTRTLCPDCREAVQAEQRGDVPVAYVPIPLPLSPAPKSGGKGGK
jgi:hypothetical protein